MSASTLAGGMQLQRELSRPCQSLTCIASVKDIYYYYVCIWTNVTCYVPPVCPPYHVRHASDRSCRSQRCLRVRAPTGAQRNAPHVRCRGFEHEAARARSQRDLTSRHRVRQIMASRRVFAASDVQVSHVTALPESYQYRPYKVSLTYQQTETY